MLDISEEIEGIPDSKESGGVILVDSEPDKNLNEPVEGKPDISTTRGVLEVNSSSNQQANSTKKTVTFSEEPIPIDHGLSHPKRTRKKNQKVKPTYDPSKLRRSTRNSRQNVVTSSRLNFMKMLGTTMALLGTFLVTNVPLTLNSAWNRQLVICVHGNLAMT